MIFKALPIYVTRMEKIMKKKLLAVLSAVLTLSMLAGCGKTTESTDVALKDIDVDKYVTLGEYKGLQVTLDSLTVDEEDVQSYMDNMYTDCISYGYATGVAVDDGITDRAVEDGDIVYIDYVGKKDDVAFDGGTAEGSYLIIGSGQFIDGFEDGLIGVMPGETVDLNLTFPESYSNSDLAGADVVFTVTVNYILPEGYNDAIIAAITATIGLDDITDEESFHQYIYDYLYSQNQEEYEYNLSDAVLNALMENCVVSEVPQELVDKYENAARQSVESAATAYGIDEDTYCSYYYGCTLDELIESIPEMVEQDLALQAVANREDLNISDDELDETLLGYAQSYGYSTIEEYIGDTSKEDYREYLMMNKVLQFLMDNAVVNN
jgi:trigger factor